MDHEEIRKAVTKKGFCYSNEKQLQEALQKRISEIYPDLKREHYLSVDDRPDFFHSGTAIEVKIRGSRSVIYRQLNRYAEYPEVQDVVLIIPKIERLPEEIDGKKLTVIEIWSLFV